MDDIASFTERIFERERLGYPPVDLQAIREGRPQPAPPPGFEAPASDGQAARGSQPPAAALRASPGSRNGIGQTAVFTVRLARDDLGLLESRARVAGIPPSTLARNLINVGLRENDGAGELAEAVRRVDDAVAQLRSALL